MPAGPPAAVKKPLRPAPRADAQPDARPAPDAGDAPPAAAREPRGARRKRETREKLLDAAMRLMSERGMDAVAINEITEAADVGFGSFYNHFESKEAVYAALMDSAFEGFADALDAQVKDLDDPAEVIAVSVRHTLLRARSDPQWGRLLLREGFSARVLSRGLGVRLLRDIRRGLESGRFRLRDPLMGFVAAGAGVLGAIAADLAVVGEGGGAMRALGYDVQDLPERAATVLLANLGVPFDTAQKIARRPLPPLDSG